MNRNPSSTPVLSDLRLLIEQARGQVAQAANSALTTLYWRVGQRIRLETLKDSRAEYGEQIVATVSRQLVKEYGKGFTEKSLRRMVQFSEVFPDEKIVVSLIRQLSWSHFVEILPLKQPLEREYYAELCKIERWSVRTLRERIGSDDFYLDLLFYNRKLKRLVAVELKMDDFQAGDKGQMELYLRWLAKYEQEEGEQSPLGIILCAGKTKEQIELLELDKSGIHVAQYLTALPSREMMQEKFHQSIESARERLAQLEFERDKHEPRLHRRCHPHAFWSLRRRFVFGAHR